MRTLLVTLSDLLAPTFQNYLNLEHEYCAIVVEDVESAKKILVPQSYPEEKIFPFYELKECIENFYFDVLLFVCDERLIWTEFPQQILDCGAPQNKTVHMNLTSMWSHSAFLMEYALRYYRGHAGEFEMFTTGISCICHAIDTEKFRRKIFSFGRGSQDLYYDYQIAKFVLSDTGGGRGKIKYALIGLVPYSFHYDESKTYKLNFNLLQYVVAFNDLHNFWLPIDEYKNLLNENFFKLRITEFEKFDVNNVFLEKTESGIGTERFIVFRKSAESWNNKNFPETREENIKILDDYLTLCEENNVTPIIFLPPMTDGRMKYFSRQKLDEFHYLVNEAIKKHPGTKFFDGWKLPIFSYENFWDSSHLNRKGAAKFSAMFNEFIESLEKNST